MESRLCDSVQFLRNWGVGTEERLLSMRPADLGFEKGEWPDSPHLQRYCSPNGVQLPLLRHGFELHGSGSLVHAKLWTDTEQGNRQQRLMGNRVIPPVGAIHWNRLEYSEDSVLLIAETCLRVISALFHSGKHLERYTNQHLSETGLSPLIFCERTGKWRDRERGGMKTTSCPWKEGTLPR